MSAGCFFLHWFVAEKRPDPWAELPQALLQAGAHPSFAIRECAYRIYSAVPQSLDPPFASPSDVRQFLIRGLSDAESPTVRLSALDGAVAWVRSDEALEGVEEVVKAMLSVLPPLVQERKEERLQKALQALVEMASVPRGARACGPLLGQIVGFIVGFVRPRPDQDGAFDEDIRQTGLELLIATGENAGEELLAGADKGRAFLQGVLPLIFEMMTEIEDDPAWYKVEKTTSEEEDDETYIVAEQGLDRLAQVFGEPEGSPFPGLCFELISSMATNDRWQVRHAALSAIGAVAEGCAERLLDQTEALSGLIERGLDDRHARVKFAAVYAVAQLCSSLQVRPLPHALPSRAAETTFCLRRVSTRRTTPRRRCPGWSMSCRLGNPDCRPSRRQRSSTSRKTVLPTLFRPSWSLSSVRFSSSSKAGYGSSKRPPSAHSPTSSTRPTKPARRITPG